MSANIRGAATGTAGTAVPVLVAQILLCQCESACRAHAKELEMSNNDSSWNLHHAERETWNS